MQRDETFASLPDWLKEIHDHAAEDVKVYLIGNKADDEKKREVSKERALEFAREYNIHKVFETSAMTGNNVEEVFSCAAREFFMQKSTEDGDDAVEDLKKGFDLGKRPAQDGSHLMKEKAIEDTTDAMEIKDLKDKHAEMELIEEKAIEVKLAEDAMEIKDLKISSLRWRKQSKSRPLLSLKSRTTSAIKAISP